MGVIQRKNKTNISQKQLSKEMRASILVMYVISGEAQLYDLGGLSASYISYIHFERLADGKTTESRLGMIFLLGELLNYIVMLLSYEIVLY